MIRSTFFAGFCSLLVTGCVELSEAERTQGLPTGVAMEAFAPKFPLGVAQGTDQVASTPSDVKARLARFASHCLDGKTIETQRVSNLGMPLGGRLFRTFRSSISNEDGINRLIISQQLSGAVLTTDAGRLPNVQFSMQILSDGSGGTTLKTTRNRTFFDLHDSAVDWASGTSTTCPGIFET